MPKQLGKNRRYIYVLLTGTNTLIARFIRFYTKEPFSHASIALDQELVELYSFARKHRFNPFNSGFVKEDLEKGVFGADKNAHCAVYRIPVTEVQYQYISKKIKHFDTHRKDYGYNFIGLFSAMFGISVDDGVHFMCSQFVYHIIHASGVDFFSTDNKPVRPFHFHMNLRDKQIYSGNLHHYREYMNCELNEDYAEEVYVEAI